MGKLKESMKENWFRYLMNLVLAGGVYWSSTWYAMTNHATANVHILQTAFDRWVPVIPQFIVPYILLEPVLYGCLLFFFVFYPKVFTAFGVAFIAAQVLKQHVIADVVGGLLAIGLYLLACHIFDLKTEA
jgi:hypothetical protein